MISMVGIVCRAFGMARVSAVRCKNMEYGRAPVGWSSAWIQEPGQISSTCYYRDNKLRLWSSKSEVLKLSCNGHASREVLIVSSSGCFSVAIAGKAPSQQIFVSFCRAAPEYRNLLSSLHHAFSRAIDGVARSESPCRNEREPRVGAIDIRLSINQTCAVSAAAAS